MSNSEKLITIAGDVGVYRTTKSVAKAIFESDHTSEWHYSTKGRWRRSGRKYIQPPSGRKLG